MRHATKRGDDRRYLHQTDPSIYMLGLPKSRPRLGNWGIVAILAGTLLALAIIGFGNDVASLFF
jgi:hypothetical protein